MSRFNPQRILPSALATVALLLAAIGASSSVARTQGPDSPNTSTASFTAETLVDGYDCPYPPRCD